MSVNLLYFSATDNTSKILKAISCKIADSYKVYDITLPENRDKEYKFQAEDLVLVGVPVYGGRIPKFLLSTLHKLSGNGAKVVCVVTYGNREYEDALLELKDLCEETGFTVIAAGAFVGEHSYTDKLAKNRPNIEDIRMAEEFGIAIKEKLEHGELNDLRVRGNFPYVEKQNKSSVFAPVTGDTCIDCGLCERSCPMGAISKDSYKDVDASKCIHCCSCVKRCPVLAKSFPQEAFLNLRIWLETNFAEPEKGNQIFL